VWSCERLLELRNQVVPHGPRGQAVGLVVTRTSRKVRRGASVLGQDPLNARGRSKIWRSWEQNEHVAPESGNQATVRLFEKNKRKEGFGLLLRRERTHVNLVESGKTAGKKTRNRREKVF